MHSGILIAYIHAKSNNKKEILMKIASVVNSGLILGQNYYLNNRQNLPNTSSCRQSSPAAFLSNSNTDQFRTTTSVTKNFMNYANSIP